MPFVFLNCQRQETKEYAMPIRNKGDTNVIIQKKTLDWKDRASLFR